jgi:hypothetical protein
MNKTHIAADKPSIFLVGGTGAGKTELALNLSVYYSNLFGSSNLIDLDIVNPYFRVRQFVDDILQKNVKVICPEARVRFGDVPALPSAAWGALEGHEESVICDVGGGEPGLRLLGRLKEIADKRKSSVYFVLNPFRPDYVDVKHIEAEFRHTCELCKLDVTEIIANPNLSDHTTAADFERGLDIVRDLSEITKIPIGFCVAPEKAAKELGVSVGTLPGFGEYKGLKMFVIERYWSVPWHFGTVSA